MSTYMTPSALDELARILDLPTAQETLDGMPCVPLSDIDTEDMCCAICLDNFDEQHAAVRLTYRCSHFFHWTCLTHWVQDLDHNTCPKCRSPVYPNPWDIYMEDPNAVRPYRYVEATWETMEGTEPDPDYTDPRYVVNKAARAVWGLRAINGLPPGLLTSLAGTAYGRLVADFSNTYNGHTFQHTPAVLLMALARTVERYVSVTEVLQIDHNGFSGEWTRGNVICGLCHSFINALMNEVFDVVDLSSPPSLTDSNSDSSGDLVELDDPDHSNDYCDFHSISDNEADLP